MTITGHIERIHRGSGATHEVHHVASVCRHEPSHRHHCDGVLSTEDMIGIQFHYWSTHVECFKDNHLYSSSRNEVPVKTGVREVHSEQVLAQECYV